MPSPTPTRTRSLRALCLLLLSCLVWTTACGDDGETSQDTTPQTGETSTSSSSTSGDTTTREAAVTWHRDIRPIIEAKCKNCHVPGGIAPEVYEMSTFEQVKAQAVIIQNAVENGSMPPWQAQDGCNEYMGDYSLDTDSVEKIRTWVADNTPEGDEADYVAPTIPTDEFNRDRLSPTPDLLIEPSERYIPDYSVLDDYRCFVIDPGFDSERFMSAFDIEVDNASILHHVVMFTVPGDPDTLAELEELENEDSEPGYRCYGGPRTSSVGVGLAWAPGSEGVILNEGVGMPIEPNTRFVLQMHYNTINGDEGSSDQSKARMWLMPEDERPNTYAYMTFLGNLPFEIPPGVSGLEAEECDVIYATLGGDIPGPANGVNARELRNNPELLQEVGKSGCVQMEFYYDFPIDLELGGVAPHMHEVGKSIKIEIDPVDNSSGVAVPISDDNICITNIPRWDFNWQRGYALKEASTLPRTGVIRLTCRYDNSLGTEPVQLGEGTGDEMCLGLFTLLSPFPI